MIRVDAYYLYKVATQPHIPLFSDVISRGCGGGDFGTQVASR